MSVNTVVISGRLGADPQIRFNADTGKPSATFEIAVNELYKKDGESKEYTSWINVVSRAPNLIEKVIKPYVKKGTKVTVSGTLNSYMYESKKFHDEEGKPANLSRVYVYINRLELGGKSKEEPPIVEEETSVAAPPEGDDNSAF